MRTCGAIYPGSGTHGSRIVACDLASHGRDVDHCETDTESTWPWAPPPPPRVWELPAEPEPEVTRLTAVDGEIILEREVEPWGRYWVARHRVSGRSISTVSWWEALGRWAPLADASGEVHGNA